MSGPVTFTQKKIRFQLQTVEYLLNCQDHWTYDTYYIKWRRHYLLKRLLTLQLKEFDNG